MIVVEPAVTPVTVPVVLTVATPVLPDDHVPPLTVLLSVILLLVQTIDGPEMVPAVAVVFTVTGVVAETLPHDGVPAVYEMVTLPGVTPVTTPVVFTVAIEVLLLDQVPEVPVVVRLTVVVGQIGVAPEITPAFGEAFTVTN